jgi:hypothetical protein
MNKTAHNKIIWSNEEVEMLKEKYEIFTNKELSVILNKSTRNVARKLKELSLYKNLDKVRNIKSRINKENGTDLSYDYVANISKKFTTKNEFYQFETNVYNKAVKEGWLKEITNHMIVKRVSLPQLILKDILEFIIDADCSYNDRTVIKPYEIDCYFPTFKIGWEYNGRYFHTDEKDEFKVKLCLDKGISLFSINEKSKTFRKYEKNIKNQLIKQISDINQLTGLNITKEMILNYKINIKPPNVLSDYEKNEVFGKKLSQIRKTNLKLYNKIKNFNIVKDESLGIIDDIKTFKKFENFDEYLEFITDNNISSFNELCKIEHPHRRVKKWGINIKELHNFLTNKKNENSS